MKVTAPTGRHPPVPGGRGVTVTARPRTIHRVRVRVRGTVQGVGFRPYVYRLAGELGLSGFVLNDAHGVLLEVEGSADAIETFLARLEPDAPPLAVLESVSTEARPPTGADGLRDPAQSPGRRRRRPGHARQRHLLGVPGGTARSRRSPLPLSVHQLHQLRPPLHDRPRGPLRPSTHHHDRLRHVPQLPSRIRGSRRPPFPRPAQRVPGMRAVGQAARRRRPTPPGPWVPDPVGTSVDTDPIGVSAGRIASVSRQERIRLGRGRAQTRLERLRPRCGTARSSRSRGSADTTSRAKPTTNGPWHGCARASTVRTNRSP